MSRPSPSTDRRRKWVGLLWLTLAMVLVFFGVRFAAQGSLPFGLSEGRSDNPFVHRSIFVNPDSEANRAATRASGDERVVLDKLAGVPTAMWLTPEKAPTGLIGSYVRSRVIAADKAKRVPLFVVYGVPDRDCVGLHSQGGLAPESYADWVREIADALVPKSVVIVEPDALASADSCGNRDTRLELIRRAVQLLSVSKSTIYLDAGHSGWMPAGDMAELLKSAGVSGIRGFSTNVSAYQSNDAERAYAQELSRLLPGAHFVIDSGRNGAGGANDWCNPSGQAVGIKPGFVEDGTSQDAYLWVKPPGESDGTCGGGPPAGTWWNSRALELVRNAGW